MVSLSWHFFQELLVCVYLVPRLISTLCSNSSKTDTAVTHVQRPGSTIMSIDQSCSKLVQKRNKSLPICIFSRLAPLDEHTICLVYQNLVKITSTGAAQEGGGITKENSGSLLTVSMTSRFGWMIFKMAPKVYEEGAFLHGLVRPTCLHNNTEQHSYPLPPEAA